MNVFQAVVLGFIQGLTEFLPVSSSAHLRVFPSLFGWKDPGAAFSAIIQIGTTLAVIAYFAKDLWGIFRDSLIGLIHRKPLETVNARLGWFIVVGTFPIGIAGLTLKNFIEGPFRSLYVVSIALVTLAAILFWSEKRALHNREIRSLGWKDAIVIGCAQAFALIPGASRSGVTLTAGLFSGLTREAAARYSFLLSVPATLAAGLFELRHVFGRNASVEIGITVIGTVAAFVCGIATIAWMMRFLKSHTVMGFIIYRVVLGLFIFGLCLGDILQPL